MKSSLANYNVKIEEEKSILKKLSSSIKNCSTVRSNNYSTLFFSLLGENYRQFFRFDKNDKDRTSALTKEILT